MSANCPQFQRRSGARGQREFRRCFGSKERMAWVQARPCSNCGMSPCVNAHVGRVGAGAGRRANYDQIAPLCDGCHRRFDAHTIDPSIGRVWCVNTEAAWQEHLDATRSPYRSDP